ncbi:oxidative damage protection protein [Sodalis-like secondary symbiont of Drepanosiphum platanoidis]|uniref:oxidative damage protection protein n=1 Tax=Sodalis-like secondary symbiont of Drepanosiphum platanoidis TaxID=2994493 RepID=UPI00346470D9
MNKIIYCFFFKKYKESQDSKLYPGNLGDKIYKNISKKAWNLWKKKQTILINENNLDMINLKHQKFLEKKMIKFLFKK